MTLLLSLAGAVVTAAVLVAGTAWRALARRDHRCVVVSRPGACGVCDAVLAGHAAGGHVVCACGAASPHLLGPELLRWRAHHQGMSWPALPAEGAARATAAAHGPDANGDGLDGGLDGGLDAQLDAELEELGEDARREVARSRRNPDPRTPQVMREAETGDVNQS
jgi:hypothetical protein